MGETSDNLPGVPGVGEGFAAKWINQYDGLDNVITHADQITGKKGEALRAHLGDVIRNRQLNALVRDLDLERRARASWCCAPWDRQTRADRSSTTWSSAASCASGPSTRSAAEEEPGRARAASSSPAVVLGRRGGGRVPRPASAASTSASTSAARWGSGTGVVDGPRGGGRQRSRGVRRRRRRSTPEDDAALAAWLADPSRPKVLHDAKGAAAGARRAGAGRWPGSGPRHRARGLPGPARPALLRPRPTSPCATSHRELRTERADDRAAHSSTASATTARRRRHGRCCTRAGRHRPGRGARRRASATASGGARLLAEVELPLVRLLGDAASSTGIARRRRPPRGAGEPLRRRGAQGRPRTRTPSIGAEINLGSPKQLQVVLFDELGMPKTKRTKTGYTTDADALQALYVQNRAPVPASTCCGTATSPGCDRPSRGCSRRSSPTAGSTPRSTR